MFAKITNHPSIYSLIILLLICVHLCPTPNHALTPLFVLKGHDPHSSDPNSDSLIVNQAPHHNESVLDSIYSGIKIDPSAPNKLLSPIDENHHGIVRISMKHRDTHPLHKNQTKTQSLHRAIRRDSARILRGHLSRMGMKSLAGSTEMSMKPMASSKMSMRPMASSVTKTTSLVTTTTIPRSASSSRSLLLFGLLHALRGEVGERSLRSFPRTGLTEWLLAGFSSSGAGLCEWPLFGGLTGGLCERVLRRGLWVGLCE